MRATKATILFILVSILALVLLVGWKSLLTYLIGIFPTANPTSDSLALVLFLFFILAVSWFLGLLISILSGANRLLTTIFQQGFSTAPMKSRDVLVYMVGGVMLTTFYMVLVYVLPAIPGVFSDLPTLAGFNLSSVNLIGALAQPDQPYAGYVQVGLWVSGPATVFAVRLNGILAREPPTRSSSARLASYLVWLTLVLLVAFYANGGGTVQGVPTGYAIVIADFFSLVVVGVVFLPIEAFIRKSLGRGRNSLTAGLS